MNVKTLAFALSFTLALGAFAADYYVGGDNANDENDGTIDAPFATIDKAFTTGGGTKGNSIYLAPGEYVTDQQKGFDLKANLIGAGATRDDVVIKSAGNYRTLRMNATDKPTVTKVTIVGCTDISKVERGGAIEMNGGTLRDCVIRDGKTYGSSNDNDGGNIYMNGDSLIENCLITGGEATKRGGNVYLDNGTIRNCTITGGSSRNVGGNVFQYKGTIENCTIENGVAVNDGGNVRLNGAGTIRGTLIKDGKITSASSSEKKGANVYMDNGLLTCCHLSGGMHENGYNAGSLCMYNATNPNAENCLIEGSAVGGVLCGATSRLYNMTIVNNEKYGVWGWGTNHTLVNCVIFNNFDGANRKEWAGNQATHSQAVFRNNATAEGALSKTTFPTLITVTESDFVDFAKGDYHQTAHSTLVDAGASDPRGATAGTLDLDGNPRVSGMIDIGCYEYQKQDMTVRLESGEYAQVWAPTTVTFTHVVEHSVSPENVVVTYDFGDGSEPVSTKASSVAHDYAKAGVYTVKLTATNECEEESAEMTYTGYVRVASSTVYVKAGNATAAYPYDTPETAYANLKTAYNEAYNGYTINVGAGVYEWGDQLSITKAVRVVGTEEDVARVVFRNTNLEPNTYYHRTVELNNAEAFLANVTIENGCVKNQYGGNLRIMGGACVSNCVIRGGLAVADNGSAAGAGVVLSGQNSTITHCTITGNTVRGTSNDQNYAGGAVFIEYGAQNIHLSNLLIVDNTYESTDSAKRGTAGVRYGGGNDWTTMENCTIAGNKVTGAALPDDSAAVYCTSWHVLFYNNIFVGNVETEKDGGRMTSVKFIYDGGSNYKYMSNITDDVVIGGSLTKSIGNMIADPKVIFKDFAKGDYTLPPTSPACNKGIKTGLALLPSVDLLGNPREFGKSIDIGCYECQQRKGLLLLLQ